MNTFFASAGRALANVVDGTIDFSTATSGRRDDPVERPQQTGCGRCGRHGSRTGQKRTFV